jgi:hypothetical protein
MTYSDIGIYRIYDDPGQDTVIMQAGDTVICKCGKTKMHIFTEITNPFEVDRANVPNYEPVNLNHFTEVGVNES